MNKLEALWALYRAEQRWRAYWNGLRTGRAVGTPDIVLADRFKAERACFEAGLRVTLAYSGNIVGIEEV